MDTITFQEAFNVSGQCRACKKEDVFILGGGCYDCRDRIKGKKLDNERLEMTDSHEPTNQWIVLMLDS